MKETDKDCSVILLQNKFKIIKNFFQKITRKYITLIRKEVQ